MIRPATAAASIALLAAAPAWTACASEPLDMSLGEAKATYDVVALGDGFVRTGGRRLPREMFVLELRQQVRRVPAADRKSIRVQIELDDAGGASALADAEWLLEQAQILGIGQARLQ